MYQVCLFYHPHMDPVVAEGDGTSGTALMDDSVPLARFFKVLSDPTRVAILRLLLERERSVGEIVEILQVPQSRVSNHMACLRWCHFVEVERESRRAIYRIADPRLADVLAAAGVVADDLRECLLSCNRIGPAWI